MKLKKPALISLLIAGTASLAHAAVITPQIGGSIDPVADPGPSTKSDVDSQATGSVTLATFISTTSNRVIQANYTGIGGSTGNTINHDAGGNVDGVDVRIAHTIGTFSATADNTQNFDSSEGGGNGYKWSGTNGQQLTISFGTASGPSNQIFTNDRSVTAAGLMLLNFGSAYTNVAINYFDSADNNLSSQSFAGTGDSQGGTFGGADFFTGHVSTSANIAYLTIDITRNTGSSNIALDAVTFAGAAPAVPEPSGAALLGLGFVGLLLRRNRLTA